MNRSASTPALIRAAAAQWVVEVAERGRSLDELLADDADEGSARGLKRSLTYGTLRWHFRLHAILVERLAREGRTEMAQACFDFLPMRARLDLAGWPEKDIFSHE